MVKTTPCPCSSCWRMPINAPTAPRELDPRTAVKPSFWMMRAIYSPSKLRLVITASRLLRNR